MAADGYPRPEKTTQIMTRLNVRDLKRQGLIKTVSAREGGLRDIYQCRTKVKQGKGTDHFMPLGGCFFFFFFDHPKEVNTGLGERQRSTETDPGRDNDIGSD